MEQQKKKIEKLYNSKLTSLSVRIIMQSVFTIALNVFLALSIQIDNNRRIYIVVTAVIFILLVSISIFYSKYDTYLQEKYKINQQDRQNLLEEIEKNKLKHISYYNVLNSIQAVLTTTSKNINALAHKIAEEKVLDEEIWSFKQTCAIICNDAYNTLKTTNSKCDEIEITYINFESTKEGTIAELNAYKNNENIMPSILEKKIIIPKKIVKKKLCNKYSFERYYISQKCEPEIFVDEKMIKSNFYFTNEQAKSECKYKQFVAVPVSCEAKKIIGIMQIASFKEQAFGTSIEEIKENIIKPMKPLGYLFLLAKKTEKCIKTLVEVKNGN